MSFAFNFFEARQKEQQDADRQAGDPHTTGRAEELHTQEDGSKCTELVSICNGIELLKGAVTSQEAAELLKKDQLEESDLVPGQYEGGFKLWEGAIDLCRYLAETYNLDAAKLAQKSASSSGASSSGASSSGAGSNRGWLAGKHVLELGCGHGLPGILCLLAGATVHFQDYNSQVLTALTAPNVGANMKALPGARCGSRRYFAGGWMEVGQKLLEQGLGGHYDLVLASECIYSEDSQYCLLECIKQVLQPPHGIAYIAAKSYYHGVGGGTTSFAQLVRADGILECEQVWKVEDGSSNKREVLKLRFPESITPYFL